jgi:hypothetical protein
LAREVSVFEIRRSKNSLQQPAAAEGT